MFGWLIAESLVCSVAIETVLRVEQSSQMYITSIATAV